MKITELTERRKEVRGTFAGVRFSDKTVKALAKYAKDNNVPHLLPASKIHTTLLYSRKPLPNYKAAGKYDEPLVGKPKGVEKWESGEDEDGETSQVLVLRYDCPKLSERHEHLMDEHDATFDYDEYRPHVTLSYDVGDMDVKDLPDFKDDLDITDEYQQEINPNFGKG